MLMAGKRREVESAGLDRKGGTSGRRLCVGRHWPGTRPTPVRLWAAHLSSPGTGQSRRRGHARWLPAAGLPQAIMSCGCISAHLCMRVCLQVGSRTPCGGRWAGLGRSDDMATALEVCGWMELQVTSHMQSTRIEPDWKFSRTARVSAGLYVMDGLDRSGCPQLCKMDRILHELRKGNVPSCILWQLKHQSYE